MRIIWFSKEVDVSIQSPKSRSNLYETVITYRNRKYKYRHEGKDVVIELENGNVSEPDVWVKRTYKSGAIVEGNFRSGDSNFNVLSVKLKIANSVKTTKLKFQGGRIYDVDTNQE